MNLLGSFISAIPMAYAALFPVLNPLGYAFVFLALTHKLSPEARRRLARKIAFNAFILLAIVFWVGEWVLQFFGVTLPIVQVAGGLVVIYIGWLMMNQPAGNEGMHGKAIENEAEANVQSFFPLTMPMTAGPGSIAVALTVGAHDSLAGGAVSLMSKLGAMAGILLACITIYFCYAYANTLTKKLGTSGVTVIIKLSAFIIFCIGLAILWHGIQMLSLTLPTR